MWALYLFFSDFFFIASYVAAALTKYQIKIIFLKYTQLLDVDAQLQLRINKNKNV